MRCVVRLVYSTDKLVVGGRAFVGFPILLDNSMRVMLPVQDWLWAVLVSGKRSSPKTWETYGRATYDFFAFVAANKIDWKSPPLQGFPSAIERYRDWSKNTIGLDACTINSRLRIITRFYEWAKKQGHVAYLPFEYESVQISREPGFLAHVDTTGSKVSTPGYMLRQQRKQIGFLTKEQVQVCQTTLTNITHRTMFNLMVRTGLRSIECRTFPEQYVFDPSRRTDLRPGQMIRVTLKPPAIKTKYDVERDIDLSYSLMEELWVYKVRHRQVRENNQKYGVVFANLFLTEAGVPFPGNGLEKIFMVLRGKVGFDVHPHRLRHTYATCLLWSLRKSKTFEGEPLLYVRDRMGHSSVSTTTIYLHLVNSLEGHLVLAHEDEVDAMFAVSKK